jgi:CheY-like chemotaxis protein
MKIVLEQAGHKVEVARDGATALQKGRAFRPDVVLCDIMLAGLMDGYALAAAMRRDPVLESAHLIALTGYGREEDRERARQAGFNIHLTKPANPAELRRLLAERPGPS